MILYESSLHQRLSNITAVKLNFESFCMKAEIMVKTCLPEGDLSQHVRTKSPFAVCLFLVLSEQTVFSSKLNVTLAEETCVQGAACPAVLCKTGLYKFIETKDFKSAKTSSFT